MVNQSQLQLQRLLEMLKRKALETSNAHSQPASNDIFTRPVVKQNCEMVNPAAFANISRSRQTGFTGDLASMTTAAMKDPMPLTPLD